MSSEFYYAPPSPALKKMNLTIIKALKLGKIKIEEIKNIEGLTDTLKLCSDFEEFELCTEINNEINKRNGK